MADVRTDVFALGCILYEMIAGIAPDQDSINERSMYVTNTLIQQPNADLGLVKLINKAVSYNTEFRYGSANDFLLELRKIAPPVLLVSRKHLRWGHIPTTQPIPPQSFELYNAGGGEIRGEIKPRAPWIGVPATTFKGNRRDVSVQVNPARIAQRGELVTGRLEINTPDIHDAEGNMLSSGDRWFIECSITLIARPAQITILERPSNAAPPITLTARRGQPAIGTFQIQNTGEVATEFRMEMGDSRTGGPANPLPEMTFSPATGTVPPGQPQTVTVRVPTSELPNGVYDSTATVRTTAGQAIVVPLSVRVLSPLDYLKSMVGIKGN